MRRLLNSYISYLLVDVYLAEIITKKMSEDRLQILQTAQVCDFHEGDVCLVYAITILPITETL